jgi:hypothetical protein
LWWDGFDVSPDAVRSFLTEVACGWDNATKLFRNDVARGLSQVALSIVERAAKIRLPPPVAQARKRVGTDQFGSVMKAVLEIAVGSFEGFESQEESSLFEKGLGLDRARTDHLPGAPPWLEGDAAPVLRQLSQLMLAHPLSSLLDELTIDDITAARDETRSLMSTMDTLNQVMTHVFGRRAFGFPALGKMVRSGGVKQEALFLLAMALFRKHGSPDVRHGMDVYRGLAPEAQTLMRNFRMLESARGEIPAFVSVLTPEKIRGAMQYSRKRAALDREIREVREAHLSEVDAFFARHPEFQHVTDTTAQEGGPQTS